MRLAKRECSIPKKKCRSEREKENERIVRKMHSASSYEANNER